MKFVYDAWRRPYPIYGYGCSVKLDAETGHLLAYAGRWKLPPIEPAPKRPVSRVAACRTLAQAFGFRDIKEPDQATLAYCDLAQGSLGLCWRIRSGSVSGTIDAVTGKLVSKELFK